MKPSNASTREWLVILVLTLVGAGLRSWSLGRLGLVHFDEGIYALTGLWVVAPNGLATLDATVIPYAPPGFPILVGLAYALLGVADVAAILVSVVCGTLIIPVAGWLGRRKFGTGAGAATAVFAALSGMHIAFSRMALTDAAFLLAWLLAISQGGRFLEKPTPCRALLMGLAVGLAQNFKYNGWLAGIILALAALLGMALHREQRRRGAVARVLGFGACGAVVAALVYLPWFLFVEEHGGYAALLTHQRSYLGGFESWWAHWKSQMDQSEALFGYPALSSAWIWASVGALVSSTSLKAIPSIPRLNLFCLAAFTCATPQVIIANLGWWAGLAWFPSLLLDGRLQVRLLGTAWLTLAILTPFYHPYARLWLPLLALGWLILGGIIATGVGRLLTPQPFSASLHQEGWGGGWRMGLTGWAIICLIAGLIGCWPLRDGKRELLPDLLDPSDSLRQVCGEMLDELPKGLRGLRLLARPPVTFYLGGKVPVQSQANLDALLRPADPTVWAVVDFALLEQEGDPVRAKARILERWEPVREWMTHLNLPTLLDMHPEAARNSSMSPFVPLILFRPKL
jgi:4-amino-4-deoxy-L-arabinose transferase-like glycosyltransferase